MIGSRGIDCAVCTLLVSLLAASTVGCSSDSSTSGGDGGPTSSTSPGGGATCESKKAKLSGSVDGTNVSQDYASNGYALVLKDFTGTIGSRGSVKVALQDYASSAGTAIASGVLTMPTEGPLAGETFCVGGGTLTTGDGGYAFTLTNLSRVPAGADAGACPGTAVSGTIAGCVGKR